MNGAVDRTCAWCGVGISQKSTTATFCSDACGKRFRRKTAAHQSVKTCAVCGGSFDASGRAHRRVVCSIDCKKAHQSQISKDWAARTGAYARRYQKASAWREENRGRLTEYIKFWRKENRNRLAQAKRNYERETRAARAISILLMPTQPLNLE